MEKYTLSTIEEALEELRQGHIIVVIDDPERENEGDLICAARFATPDNINFMATYGKGLICMPMSEVYTKRLDLNQMVTYNTDNHHTAFTVSIDHISTTTGISAVERSVTAMKCISPEASPSDFRRPGHMFPLKARKGGVLIRAGHTEATVDLMRLAGLEECGLCCEIMREDGTMMRTPELVKFAAQHGMKIVSIADLIRYRRRHEKTVERVTVADLLAGRAGRPVGAVVPSYLFGDVRIADPSEYLPSFVVDGLRRGVRAFDRRIAGFASDDAILTGPETRTSSPVRIRRDENRTLCGTTNVYPCGEGAGYAGGITSSAADGLYTALALASRYAAF